MGIFLSLFEVTADLTGIETILIRSRPTCLGIKIGVSRLKKDKDDFQMMLRRLETQFNFITSKHQILLISVVLCIKSTIRTWNHEYHDDFQ